MADQKEKHKSYNWLSEDMEYRTMNERLDPELDTFSSKVMNENPRIAKQLALSVIRTL